MNNIDNQKVPNNIQNISDLIKFNLGLDNMTFFTKLDSESSFGDFDEDAYMYMTLLADYHMLVTAIDKDELIGFCISSLDGAVPLPTGVETEEEMKDINQNYCVGVPFKRMTPEAWEIMSQKIKELL